MRAKYTPRTNPSGSFSGYFASQGRGNECRKEYTTMKNICYVRQETLGNLAGRIDYISSETRQEHLYATYDTAPEGFWRDLAKENRNDFLKYGTTGECIEAREFIIALPPEMFRYDHDQLLRYVVDKYKERYQVECTAALHHNKAMTNFHIHMIYSERRELAEPIVKIATRDRYYDPQGKHVRTKKEATDAKGNLLPGYSKIPKGEVYENHRFDSKDKRFKDKDFLDEAKEFFTETLNPYLSDKTKLQVFPKNSPYLATKKIGKNNPRAEQIKVENQLRDEWNKQVERARQLKVPYKSMQHVKRRLITDHIYKSRKAANGRYDPVSFHTILSGATRVLGVMIRRSMKMPGEEWYKAWVEMLDDFITFCFEMIFGVDLKYKNINQKERNRNHENQTR